MLGALELSGADGQEQRAVLTHPKRVALLVYLTATLPHRFHRRDSLLALLWPELDQHHARAALRQALHGLRQALGAGVVASRGDEEVAVDERALWSDVPAFERAAAAGDGVTALELYRGDFLAGFFLSGAPEFERWLEEERARLRHAASQAASARAQRYRAEQDPKRAAEYARRALALSPDDEGLFRQLITLLDALGDRAGALQAYEEFERKLAEDFEAQPAAESQALIAAVRARQQAVVAKPPRVEAAQTATPEPTAAASAPRRPVMAVVATVAAAALILVAVAIGFGRGTRLVLEPHRVVVAPFVNRTGDTKLDPLGAIAADWITRGLAQTGLIEVADPPYDHPRSNASGEEWLQQIAEDGRAATVIWGAFYGEHDSLRFEAQISDARRGALLRSVEPVTGRSGEPLHSIELLRQRVTGSLATIFDAKLRSWATMASQPPSFDAYRSLLAGLEANNRLDMAEALRRFNEAANFDSTYTLPLVLLAKLHSWRGACAQADSLGQRLAAARPRLPNVDRFLLDRALAECRGDVAADYEAAHSLAEAMPGSDYAAAELGRIAVLANRPREAVAAFDRIDPERGTLRGNPTYYLWLTSALHMLGAHDRELKAGRRAQELYPNNLATLREELFALAALGRVQEIEASLVAVPLLPPHPIRRPGTVMRETALELEAHGFTAASREILDSTLGWLQRRPPEEQETEPFLFELARTFDAAGRWTEAESLARRLVFEHPDNVGYLGLLGALAAQRGDRDEAERIDGSLAALRRPYLRGYQTYWRAAIAARLGARDRSVALLSQAFVQGLAVVGVQPAMPVEYNRELHADVNFRSLRGFPPFQELLRPKG